MYDNTLRGTTFARDSSLIHTTESASCYFPRMVRRGAADSAPPEAVSSSGDSLTADQRSWLVSDEKRWQRAYQIAARHPGVDAGGVYRVLRNLEKTPSERLRASLFHGRLFSSHRR
jgi:hypothetical protein